MSAERAVSGKGRILVIDDDGDHCVLLARCLARFGFTVTTTTSAFEGLELASRGGFSAVLTDVDMSEMSGIEVCERMRSSRDDVPVIVVTGFGNAETVSDAKRVGAYELFTKPIEAERLGAGVIRAVELHDRLAPGRVDH